MGMYDDIFVNGRHGQTKALGRGLRSYEVGDRVFLCEAPVTEAELDGWYAGTWDGTREETTFQCGVYPDGWLLVIDGILVAWLDEPVNHAPRFSNLGRPWD